MSDGSEGIHTAFDKLMISNWLDLTSDSTDYSCMIGFYHPD